MPAAKVADKSVIETITEFESRRTAWSSIWICNTLQMLNGIQFSMFFTSMWPFLRTLDPEVSIDFFGWVIAIFSAGQTIASFLFGIWNQATRSTKYPVSCGIVLMAVGNLLYAILPMLKSGQKWAMFAARLTVGFGTGNLSVLRGYIAIGSNRKDRVKACSLGFGMFVLGLSIGPVLMAMVTPIGADGFHVGSFPLTMYNAPAVAMFFVNLAAIVVIFTCFQENYAGMISADKEHPSHIIVPKFDKIPAAICIGLWFALQCVVTNAEALMTPLTMVLYDWSNRDAIFWNGTVFAALNVISFSTYLLIALTKVGKIDKRKMMLFGLACFFLHHTLTIPWPFYSGPLHYIPTAPNSTFEDTANQGGCSLKYEWCSYTTRIPLPVFLLSTAILLGLGFPCIASPSGTLFSEILGPRNQGFMQGLFAFVGSIGRFSGPIVATALFDQSGYLWTTVLLLIILLISIATVLVFYGRLIALQLIPRIGVATSYKHGVFYRL